MNRYINLKRIEFFVTLQCSGKCKHCSVVEKLNTGKCKHVDITKATEVINRLCSLYDIESVMTFGGEPLLYSEVVCSIHKEAENCNVGKRQLITNGYFSKSEDKITEVADKLYHSGVNAILLSVDTFHQEVIPLASVRNFAKAVLQAGIENIALQPAWVVSEEDDNTYNRKTREILHALSDLNIRCSKGNNIFPSGNAEKYLSEYFSKGNLDLSLACGRLPYTDPLDKVSSISIEPDGEVYVCRAFSIGNIYNEDIEEIISRYNPYKDERMSAILNDGIIGLIKYAEDLGISIDKDEYYSVCDICVDIKNKIAVR